MALGTTSIDGLFSGLDTASIISSLTNIQRKPITVVENRIKSRQQTLAAYQSLTAQVLSLQSASANLATGSSLQARTVKVSENTALVASAGAGTAVGTYEITVNRLAEAHKVSSGAIADEKAELGFAGDLVVNGKTVTLAATDSLEALRDGINDAGAGVAASILKVSETDQRLVLRSLKTGMENAIEVTGEAGFLATLGLHDLQAAVDAEIEVDGYTLTRASNSIDDAVAGMSLDLLVADPTKTLEVTVGANYQAAISAVQGVVNSYNAIVNTLNAGQSFDTETNTGGAFFSESAILMLQEGLHGQAMSPAGTLGGSLTLMSQLGLGTDRYGALTLDTAKLQEKLEADPQGVMRLLGTRAETTSGEVSFEEAGAGVQDSGAAGYAVNITQAATRAKAVSGDLVGGIARDETLTINGQYNVLLEAGTTLEQAAEKLNAVFEGNKLGITASASSGRLELQSDFYGSNYGISLVSSLGDGEGGTDLGGATAGTAETVYGTNVAGTIGGKAATGWGQWLTGDEGAVKGLKLKVTSTEAGEKGAVKVSQGLASRLSNYCTQVTESTQGLLSRASAAIDDNIEALSEDVERMEASVTLYTERLQLKFAAAEGIIAKNKTVQQYLTTQLASLTGTKVDSEA
ncbi:MAG: flagellar filament capping protein FliD [Armatimonadia bacterium]